MREGITGIFNRTLRSWAQLTNEYFPRYECSYCLRALENFDGTQRFCFHCKLPLF